MQEIQHWISSGSRSIVILWQYHVIRQSGVDQLTLKLNRLNSLRRCSRNEQNQKKDTGDESRLFSRCCQIAGRSLVCYRGFDIISYHKTLYKTLAWCGERSVQYRERSDR